ncbi:MAG: metallophosphoesterase [Acidobacteriota bacterium]
MKRPGASGSAILYAVAIGVLSNAAIGAERASFVTIRKLYNWNTVCLPAILFLAALAILVAARRKLGRAAIVFLAVSASLFLLRFWMSWVEMEWLAIRYAPIESSKVRRPLRIVHLSDLQPTHVGFHEEHVFRKVRALAPDLLLYTGDLIQPRTREDRDRELPRMAALLATVKAPLGKLAVHGDTDDAIRGVPAGELGGLELLESSEKVIPFDGGTLSVHGLSQRDSHGLASDAGVARWLAAAAPGAFTILMGHAPDYLLALQNQPVDLCLAGHTHGGQIVVPFYGPLVTYSLVPRQWARGFHFFGKTRFNVSAGAGAEHAAGLPSMRLFCPTEITVIEVFPRP